MSEFNQTTVLLNYTLRLQRNRECECLVTNQ